MSRHRVIAIDGPAASGKSTVARSVARKLGYLYVNSGSFYRATTWFVLEKGVEPADETAVTLMIQTAKLRSGVRESGAYLELEGINAESKIHAPEVNANVSLVSRVPAVRDRITSILRAFAEAEDLVMEGRDIGSTVFPETPYKFYIDASPEVRAQRRAAQGQTDDLAARDRIDSQRSTSPLTIAEDAHVIDSSRLTVDGVVGEVIGLLKQLKLPLPASI